MCQENISYAGKLLRQDAVLPIPPPSLDVFPLEIASIQEISYECRDIDMAIGESLVLGTELPELNYTSDWDWFIKTHPISEIWQNQPTYVASHFLFIFGALCTFLHAISGGGRLPFLWFSVYGHGVVTEMFAYWLPDVDNFWHSTTPIMLLGRRLPLHISLLYPCFLYNAMVGIGKLRLPRWSEPFATGLLDTFIDLPYDIICVKFVHWTWHDTDPNIYDRMYWVPWNSYYFHSTFGAGFCIWFHLIHDWMGEKDKDQWTYLGFWKESLTAILTAFLGMPTGVLMFVPVYHFLHDSYGVHSEITYFVIVAVFLSLAWSGDRMVKESARPKPGQTTWTGRTWILLIHLICHYTLWMVITVFGDPSKEVSTGLHETVGPCQETVPVQTVFGKTLQKRKYLCATDYDEKYFDFHCLPGGKPPKAGSSWYTICGTPYENKMEYVTIMIALCFSAIFIFKNVHFCSAHEDTLLGKKIKNTSNEKTMKSKTN